jgi:FtsH-binding integral membrane protein
MQEETVVFWLFTFVIAGGVFVIVSALKYRAKILEMAHRERLAMIERGLKPAGPLLDLASNRPSQARSSRMMSGGIVVVGFGLALAMVIGFTSREPEIAIGIGGAVAILGAAFIVTAYVKHQVPTEPEPDWRPRSFDSSTPLPPDVPPTNER